MTTTDSRMANEPTTPNLVAPDGPDSLGGQSTIVSQHGHAAGGQTSPQATTCADTIGAAPAGNQDTLSGQPATIRHWSLAAEGRISPQANDPSASTGCTPAGSKTSRSQGSRDTQSVLAAAANFPGGQRSHDTHSSAAAGEQSS